MNGIEFTSDELKIIKGAWFNLETIAETLSKVEYLQTILDMEVKECSDRFVAKALLIRHIVNGIEKNSTVSSLIGIRMGCQCAEILGAQIRQMDGTIYNHDRYLFIYETFRRIHDIHHDALLRTLEKVVKSND